MKKNVFVLLVLLINVVLLFIGCASTKPASSSTIASNGSTVSDDIPIKRGIDSWNFRGPSSATAFWSEIKNPDKKAKYLAFVDYYLAGEEIILKVENLNNDAELLEACNASIRQFLNITDRNLELPEDVKSIGVSLSKECISKLLEKRDVQAAKVLYSNAEKAYNEAFSNSKNEIKVVKLIIDKINELEPAAKSTYELKSIDEKITKFDILYNSFVTTDSMISNEISSYDLQKCNSVVLVQKNYKKIGQDIVVQREKNLRAKAYSYKENITASFSKEAPAGSGKKGVLKYEELLGHYSAVQSEMNSEYKGLISLKSKYSKEISQDIIDEIEEQKRILDSKIYEVNRELANEKEIASRGTAMTPLMIGLFNPDTSSTADNKKSRPAKFSSENGKKNEYWWGMASIPAGQMNDLVITLKDNRTVRVFNQNTRGGKDIKKKGLTDLVSKSSKVGNSWPVLNAGAQLHGTNYYFEVQKDSSENYSGDVTIYSSFITKRR